MKKFDGIIFDLDGTLWDRSVYSTEAWNRVLRRHPEYGLSVTVDDIKGVMGLSLDEIELKLLPSIKDPDERKKMRIRCGQAEIRDILKRGGVMFPGVEETMEKLSHKYRLFMVSNCQNGYLEAFLKYYGNIASHITDYEYWERTGLSKGENIRLVCERNGLRNAVYVGDTEGDARAARAAGVAFVHALYGFGAPGLECYRAISTFGELLDL